MGYLVLKTSDNRRFDIIDGQQRMTTISVLILATLSYLQDLIEKEIDAESNAKRVEQLRNAYIGYLDPVTLVSQSKLELNRHNNNFYQTYLVPLDTIPQRGLNASEHLLRKAFVWFKDNIKTHCEMKDSSGRDAAKFVDMLVDRLFFTVITVADELNAFTVFETLNARGVRLSATDLLKNYLFSLISGEGTHENELKKLEDRWERIVGLLSSESFPRFLRAYWNSHQPFVREADLFKAIRRSITTKEAAFELLRNLDYAATVYTTLLDPQDKIWNDKESKALKELLMFSVRQPLPMLIACYTKFYEKNRAAFDKIIKAVAIISFRYNVIGGLNPRDQEPLYNNIARKISDGTLTDGSDIIDNLKDVYPNDEKFKVAFANKELSTKSGRNKKIVRYILFAIEKQQSKQDFNDESAIYSLEHILPENPSDEWVHIDEINQDKLVYRLGNMTLLDVKSNDNIGNLGYTQKREAYAKSTFKITQAIAENYDVWDADKIESRQKQMSKIASGIWKIS